MLLAKKLYNINGFLLIYEILEQLLNFKHSTGLPQSQENEKKKTKMRKNGDFRKGIRKSLLLI